MEGEEQDKIKDLADKFRKGERTGTASEDRPGYDDEEHRRKMREALAANNIHSADNKDVAASEEKIADTNDYITSNTNPLVGLMNIDAHMKLMAPHNAAASLLSSLSDERGSAKDDYVIDPSAVRRLLDGGDEQAIENLRRLDTNGNNVVSAGEIESALNDLNVRLNGSGTKAVVNDAQALADAINHGLPAKAQGPRER